MFLSTFDIFKIGLGPSSSHTMGPMTAASRFLDLLRSSHAKERFDAIKVRLFGSLAFTGKGHATDRAVIVGLLGHTPAEIDPAQVGRDVEKLSNERRLRSLGVPPLKFDPHEDIIFDYGPALPGHANGIIFDVFNKTGDVLLSETYYSIGGGFVVSAEELSSTSANVGDHPPEIVPFPFGSAAAMLNMARESGLSVAAMKRKNEEALLTSDEVDHRLDRVWRVMNSCIDRGLDSEGELPGGLRVKRRAGDIHRQLLLEATANDKKPHTICDWLSAYAMAVNEENAAGGQVVTAPTNGAAGVVPAVLRYYLDHCSGAHASASREFLLTAAAIGGIIKHNASISGAEVGCQGEVGSAAAMAAAGLCAVLGGSPEQVENAAEIALEHHLGMTCDPVAGLVQVPCIERNGIASTKAVAAASLALRGNGKHYMPLDNCISAMRQIGEDMNVKLKETSLGGLAVNLPEC